MLVRVENREVTVRPIAGTRRRGATPAEDEALAQSLLEDEKERAEHMMLVDLGRNDVGRVAQYGTVRVTDLLTVERYSHVQHLVSEVRGQLRDGLRRARRVQGVLPGRDGVAARPRSARWKSSTSSSRSGAGRTPVRSATWAGGGQSGHGASRSAPPSVLKDRVVVQAGAGIVADSDPAREFAETEAKAQAVLRALALAKAGD